MSVDVLPGRLFKPTGFAKRDVFAVDLFVMDVEEMIGALSLLVESMVPLLSKDDVRIGLVRCRESTLSVS